MNTLIKGWGHVCIGSLAGAGLGAAAFLAIEPLMPPPSSATAPIVEAVAEALLGNPETARRDQVPSRDATIGASASVLAGFRCRLIMGSTGRHRTGGRKSRSFWVLSQG